MVTASVPLHRLHPARLSPQEMLKRFRVLCGEDLPEDTVPVLFVPTALDALMVPPVIFPDTAPVTDVTGPVSFVPTPSTPVASTLPGTTLPGIPVLSTPNIPIVPALPSPVPEPGSLLLLATGLLGAVPVVLRRRR